MSSEGYRGETFKGLTVLALVTCLAQGTCLAQRACTASPNWSQDQKSWLSFTVPEDWSVTKLDHTETNTIVMTPKGYEPGNAPCRVMIQLIYEPRGGTLESASDWYFESFKAVNPGMKALGTWTNGSLGNAPVMMRSYEFPDDGRIEHGTVLTRLTSGQLIAVIVSSDLAAWTKSAFPILSRIIESANVNDAAAVIMKLAARVEANKCYAAALGSHDDARAVSFDYPTDWQAVPTEDGSTVRVSPKGTDYINAACGLELFVVNWPPSGGLKAGILDYFQRLQKSVPGT